MIISNTRITQAVSNFSDYYKEIQILSSIASERDKDGINNRLLRSILNGEVTLALHRLVPIDIRKEAGLFFTSNTLAEKVAFRLAPLLQRGTKLWDPACGAGNLLLACAQYLPMGKNIDETLTIWSDLIFGCDLYIDFIRVAQLRLVLMALSRHPEEKYMPDRFKPHQIFKGLNLRDAFAQPSMEQGMCIAVNPPFCYIQAPTDCKWATGKIQAAAWFFEQLLYRTTKGQHIVAILPDVLRSGTRYRRWRNIISSLCYSIDIENAGRFDNSTDVDVFIIHAIRGNGNSVQCEWPTFNLKIDDRSHVVSDFFDVRIGSVVPHRDLLKGPSYPYIHARTAPAWQTVKIIPEKRRYTGTVFSPPFLVVHRTSSPSDKHRCVATIINEKRNVAVENHLLVLIPHDRSLESCEQLLKLLKSAHTNEWLNNRIRCRHLTVSAIRELPCSAIGNNNKSNL